MSRNKGQLLFIVLLLVIFSLSMVRAFFQQEEGPVFLTENRTFISVELGHGFDETSIHQFIDGINVWGVIKMTDKPVLLSSQQNQKFEQALQSGQRVDLVINNHHIEELTISWMSAAKRMALGIPLHPDRMDEADWQVLPGIGEKMARRIEENRHKYGDFGTFRNLKRVSGIGEKRLTTWNQYFFAKTISAK